MKRYETIATLALALLIAALILSSIGAYTTTPERSTITCQEDMACWDCRSMGNQVCGPDNEQGLRAGDYGSE